MYQQISSADFRMIVIVPIILFSIFGVDFLVKGVKKKSRNFIISGILAFAMAVAIIPFIPAVFEKEDKKHAAMVSNILTKYNDEYSWMGSSYLKDVKYEGKGTKNHGKYTYFTLIYGDDSVSKIKFAFSDATGEPNPQCACDLKRLQDFNMKAGGQ